LAGGLDALRNAVPPRQAVPEPVEGGLEVQPPHRPGGRGDGAAAPEGPEPGPL